MQSEKYSATNAYRFAFVYYLWQRNGNEMAWLFSWKKQRSLNYIFGFILLLLALFGCRLAVVWLSFAYHDLNMAMATNENLNVSVTHI